MLAEALENRYAVAKDAARRAGQLAMQYYRRREAMGVSSKGIQNVVTMADKQCEDLIASAVLGSFPSDAVLGEETGFHNKGGDIIWIVDPIDGTSNFVREIPQWCISIGVLAGLTPVIGIIYDPVHDELYHSLAGRGAYRNQTQISVSRIGRLDEAHVGLGFSFRRPVSQHVSAVEACLNAHCEYSRLGSGALSLAYVADGRLEGYWEAHMNAWDVAGGIALVAEAGGFVSDFFADDGLNSGNPILACAPGIAEPLKKLFSL